MTMTAITPAVVATPPSATTLTPAVRDTLARTGETLAHMANTQSLVLALRDLAQSPAPSAHVVAHVMTHLEQTHRTLMVETSADYWLLRLGSDPNDASTKDRAVIESLVDERLHQVRMLSDALAALRAPSYAGRL